MNALSILRMEAGRLLTVLISIDKLLKQPFADEKRSFTDIFISLL